MTLISQSLGINTFQNRHETLSTFPKIKVSKVLKDLLKIRKKILRKMSDTKWPRQFSSPAVEF